MNMQAMLKQAQALQKDMLKVKNEIDNTDFVINNNGQLTITHSVLTSSVFLVNAGELRAQRNLMYCTCAGGGDLNNNWWGSNTAPYEVDTNIILQLTSVDSPAVISEEVNIIAGFIGSNGREYDLPPVEFKLSSDTGYFSIDNGMLVDNQVKTTYLDAEKEGNIYFTVDDETISYKIYDYARKTEIIFDDITEVPINYQATIHAKVQSCADTYYVFDKDNNVTKSSETINSGYITFYIDDGGYVTPMKALSGMTWEEFVNDEQGFLGFKKGLADAGTTLLNILDSVGGLKTALLSIGVILLNITKEQTIGKIVQFFAGKGFIDKFKNFITSFPNKLKNIPSKLKDVGKSFSEYDELMEIARARTVELANAEEELSTAKIALVKAQETGIGITEAEEAVKSAETKVEIANTEATEANNAAKAASATVISTITAGITALIVVYQIYNAIQRNHVESLRKEAEQAQNEYEQINELRTNLKDLASDLKDNNITQEEAQKKYIESAAALKKLGINADEVAGTYTNLTDKLAALNKELANKEWEKAKNVETTAAAKLENKADEFLIPNATGPSIPYSFVLGGGNAEQMLDKYDKLVEKKEKLLEQNKEESALYKYISKTIGEMSEEMEAYRNALTEKASAYVVSNVDIKNADEYNKLVKEITDGKGEWAKSTETYRNILVSEIMLAYPKYASQVSQVEKDTKNTAADLSEVKNKYEDISNALKKILDDEQNAKQLASYNEKIKEAQLDVEKAREKVADAIKEKEQAQKDLAKKQLELKKAIAKAQADYINNAIDKYIDKLDVSNDKEEKLKAIEEAKTDLAEKRLEVEEKRLELAKEEEKLAKLKEQRTIKQFSQASQSFEFVADEKKVQDQIDAVDKAREAVNSAEKAVVGAEEKIADAQNSLNDWLKNQAINEIKKYIENGGTSEKKINSILDKWLGQSGNGKLSSEMKSWKNGVTKTIDTASKKATTQNKEIKKSIESAKNAVKSAKEALKKKEQGIIDANKDVKSAIKKVDETKVDKQTYLKTQAINAVTALLSDGKSHTSKEVQSLIGSYGLSSNIEGQIWNTIVKAGGFNPSVKGTRRHWKTYDDATKDGITGLFTLNEFNLRKKSNSKATKDYADYQAYLDAMYAKYKGGSNVYDKGGILHGLGGIKATNSPETVLDPALTKKILEPSSNSNFTNFAKSLGVLFGASDNLARASYTTNSGNTTNTDNRNYTINGVPFTQQQVNTHTLGELLETAAFLRE